MRTDKDRLDALQALTTGYGGGWILRLSSNGRGMRLQESTGIGTTLNVRDAIDSYLNELQSIKSSGDRDRDWKEDFPHENGRYQNGCTICHELFLGHKRRIVCKKCSDGQNEKP